jgi:hypothetical protein
MVGIHLESRNYKTHISQHIVFQISWKVNPQSPENYDVVPMTRLQPLKKEERIHLISF